MKSEECKKKAHDYLRAAHDILGVAQDVPAEGMSAIPNMLKIAEISVATAQVYATLATVLDPVDMSVFMGEEG